MTSPARSRRLRSTSRPRSRGPRKRTTRLPITASSPVRLSSARPGRRPRGQAANTSRSSSTIRAFRRRSSPRWSLSKAGTDTFSSGRAAAATDPGWLGAPPRRGALRPLPLLVKEPLHRFKVGHCDEPKSGLRSTLPRLGRSLQQRARVNTQGIRQFRNHIDRCAIL